MIAVGLANFKQEVLESPDPVLVDISATWCQPCKLQHQILQGMEPTLLRRKIVTLNADDEQELAVHFKVSGLPTMILFKDGKEIQRVTGLQQASVIEKMFATA